MRDPAYTVFRKLYRNRTTRRFLPVPLRDRLHSERKLLKDSPGLVADIASFLDRLGTVTSMVRSFIGRTFGAVKLAFRGFRPFLFSTPPQLLAMKQAPSK
jgi:hypothetical protein